MMDVKNLKPLKLQNFNIRTDEKPKIASIGDYWDEKTIKEIFDLLREFEYLFPVAALELKGTKGDLYEMKIILKDDAN